MSASKCFIRTKSKSSLTKKNMNIARLFRLYTTVDKLKGNEIETGTSRVWITELPTLLEQKSKQSLFIV